MNKETITISMEEYKELLIIKGKYEELKTLYSPYYPTKITYRSDEAWVDSGIKCKGE